MVEIRPHRTLDLDLSTAPLNDDVYLLGMTKELLPHFVAVVRAGGRALGLFDEVSVTVDDVAENIDDV